MANYKLVSMHSPKFTIFSRLMFVLGIAFLLVGLSIALRDARTNRLENIAAAKMVAEANRKLTKSTTPIATLASAAVPATTKPAVNLVAEYVVAPDMPRYLIIPKLGVDARILSVGLDDLGALKTPASVFDTAWFNQSSLPGQQGAMLIDGHVSSWKYNAVFHDLKKLVAGNVIKVVRGDDSVFEYAVVKVQFYPADNVDMVAATMPIDAGKPGLNLITCAGGIIPGTKDFDQRVIVFASKI